MGKDSLKRKTTQVKSKPRAADGKKHPSGHLRKTVGLDLKAICSIDHECVGCSDVMKSCCAKYDVCVDEATVQGIIPFLPEASEFCPHLKTLDGYDNVFEEGEKGQYSIETHENDLCVFAYTAPNGLIRCSLHSIEINHGLAPGSVKPAVCMLFPLTFSEDGHTLTLHDGALSCDCSSLRERPSRLVSPALAETIRQFGGEISAP